MGKSRKSKSNIVKSITKNTLPTVNKGLTTVGKTAKNVASASIPVIEQGVSVVYGTMATGLDLGVKRAKTLTKGMSSRKKHRRHNKRTHKGGRRRRRH
jgi:hypothetical protein